MLLTIFFDSRVGFIGTVALGILVGGMRGNEFGIAAMAFILVSSLGILNSFGTGTAFVRDTKSNKKKAENTLFYLDAIPSILIAVLTFFLAPYAAAFFSARVADSYTTLLWMMRAAALLPLFNLFSIIFT